MTPPPHSVRGILLLLPPQAKTTRILPIVLKFHKGPSHTDPTAGDGTAAAGETSATPVTMTVVVGCAKTNDAKKSSAGSFEVITERFHVKRG